MVLLTHSHQLFEIPTFLFGILDFLQLGCQMFFVFSAFGICFSYNRRPVSWFVFMKERLSGFIFGYWFMILFFIIYQAVTSAISGNSIFGNINIKGVIINLLFLNGLSTSDFINNNIVSSGWFIGTLVLLYALFPALYRLYEIKSEKWRKVRLFAFPVLIFITSFTVINIAGLINSDYVARNPIVYRFFLNQLPCFAIGFSLYDIYKTKKVGNVRLPLLFSMLFLSGSIVFFYLDFSWTGSLYHILFSAAFAFFFIFVNQQKNIFNRFTSEGRCVVSFVRKCGKISFFIYMMQSIVMFYMTKIVIDLIIPHYANELVLYLLILPFSIALSCAFGKILSIADNSLRSIVKKQKP